MRSCIFAVLLLVTVCGRALALRPGDNVREAFRKLSRTYVMEAPPLTDWSEGAGMLFICSKRNPLESDAIFIALPDSSLVGVYIPSDTVFMFNDRGDDTLGFPTSVFVMPAWVVKRATKTDPADKAIMALLDEMYEKVLQEDNGQLTDAQKDKYELYKTQTSLKNRHIALMFSNYQSLVARAAQGSSGPPDPRMGITVIKQLSAECRAVFGRVPAIVYVYTCEAYMAARLDKLARKELEEALVAYPASVPLNVYRSRLEENEKTRRKMIDKLKAQHPAHWMVRDLR